MLSFIKYQGRIVLKGVDALSKYYSIHEFSKIIGVSAQTLRNWDANGNLHPHHTTEKSEQQELVEDLVQIITVFSCKLQGKQANKARKLIRELIQEETDGKSHKSNVDTKQRTEN